MIRSNQVNSLKGFVLRFYFLFACLILTIANSAALSHASEKEGIAFFEKNIRPVFVRHCYKCHSKESDSPKGGLLLDSRDGMLTGGDNGTAIVPGEPDESLLLTVIRYDCDEIQMPPDGKLDDNVIDNFEKWIELGAPDPRAEETTHVEANLDVDTGKNFWAFKRPQKSAVPVLPDDSWPKTDIDRLVSIHITESGLKPVADASRGVLIRRTYFDLIGLPPTPKEVDDFVNDKSPEAFAHLIDRLLDSPRFGERWGRHWLDVARYAESTGRSVNFPLNFAWRYRNYVIESFNKDKPYDQFIREQIAGDLLPAENDQQANEQQIATGFLAVGPRALDYDDREQSGTDGYFLHSVDEQIDVTCRGVLALTVSCAQCHDHKFDPIPTKDYYALAGIFRSSRPMVGYVHGLGNSGRYYPANLATLKGFAGADYESLTDYVNRSTAAWDTLKENMTELWLIRREEGQPGFTNQQRETQEKIVKDHRAKLVALAKKFPAKMPVAIGVVDGSQPADMHVCVAGDVENLGELAPRGFLKVLGVESVGPIPSDQSGRLQLADWLTSEENPLTARVMVNRVWHHLFGQGLVPTVDNFGANGTRPSHPELLDYLAVQFMDQGWSVKQAIRDIMLSRVYQLSSNHDANNFDVDPDNRLLWRMNRRPLEIEAIRDAMLSVSGRLDLSRPGGSPLLKTGAVQITSSSNMSKEAATPRGYRRAVYQTLIRDMEPEMFRVFDFPSTSSVHGRRDTTIVATQALFLMNNPFVMEQSRHAAERLLADESRAVSEQVELAYRFALSRKPSALESQQLLDYLSACESDGAQPLDAWSGIFQTLFGSAEFRYLE